MNNQPSCILLYKMKNYIYLLFISFLCITSCGRTKQENLVKTKADNNLDTYTLKIYDTLILQSDFTHSVNSNFFAVSDEKLLQQNVLDNSIYTFDLKSQKKLFKLSVPEYGPEKIGKIQGFFFENTDSIYIVSPLDNEIKLIDSVMNIHKIYKIDNDKVKIASFSQMPLLKFDSLFFINSLPDYDYFKNPRFLIYNKNSKEIIDKLSISDFIENNNYDLLFALNSIEKLNESEVAISIGVDENVFVYDLKSKKIIRTLNVSSGKFQQTQPLVKTDAISTKERLERNYYKSIHKISINNKDFLLRTTSLSIEPYDSKGNLKSLYDKEQSVILYDLSNEQKVGEFYLPNDIYDFRTGFVFDNRLYFLLNNPNSPKDENLMKFAGYEIHKI